MAIFFSALMNATVKGLSLYESVLVITAWRYLLGAALAVLAYLIFRPVLPGWQAVPFHLMRGFFQVLAAASFFWSLTQIPIVTAIVLSFTGVLMVAPVAWVILKEPIKPAVMGATLVGFGGALFIIASQAPIFNDNSGSLSGYVVSIFSALCHTFAVVLLRLRSQSESPVAIAFFANTLPAFYVLPVLFISGSLPEVWLFSGYLLTAFFGVCFWSLLTFAYAQAPAARLAPINYTQLLWAALVGLLFFSEIPAWQTWVGAVIIVSSCLYVLYIKGT